MPVTPNSVVTPQAISCGGYSFMIADTQLTAKKTLYTAGANGSLIRGIVCTNIVTATARVLYFYRDVGGAGTTLLFIGSVTLAASVKVPTVGLNLTNFPGAQYDEAGNAMLLLGPADKLAAAVTVTCVADNDCDVCVQGLNL